LKKQMIVRSIRMLDPEGRMCPGFIWIYLRPQMKPTVYLGYFMAGVFMVVSILCLIAPYDNPWLPGNRRFIMSAVMASYAAIRFYRLRKYSKESA